MAEKYIEKDYALVQKFLDENLGDGRKLTGAEIFEALESKLKSKVTKAVFMSSLSMSVKAGKITGVEGRKSVGYVKVGDTVKVVRNRKSLRERSVENKQRQVFESKYGDEDVDNSDKSRFGIQVTKSIRLVVSARNITRQKRIKMGDSFAWVNQAYHSTFSEAFTSCIRFMIKSKAKSDTSIIDIKDVITRFDQIEASILAELIGKVGDIPLDKKVSQLIAEDMSA